MMILILIITWYTPRVAVSATTAEFATIAACEEAAKATTFAFSGNPKIGVTWVCRPKGSP